MAPGSSACRRGLVVLAARQRRFARMSNLPEEDVYNGRIHHHGMEVTFLGTSSQVCTRRHPSSLALRLSGHNGTHTWLFDAGEGALAQMQRSHLRVSQLSNIFITHMHPDHVYGLPGIVMAALSSRDAAFDRCRLIGSEPGPDITRPLSVYGPPGIGMFLRASLGATLPSFRESSLLRIVELPVPRELISSKRHAGVRPFWNSTIKRLPFEVSSDPVSYEVDSSSGKLTYNVMSPSEAQGDDGGGIVDESHSRETAAPAVVQAGIISHSVPSIAYVIEEDVSGFRFDKEKLAAVGLPVSGRFSSSGRDLFRQLMAGESVDHCGRVIKPSDVQRAPPKARRIAICGDTNDASGVSHLASGVDVLVHEATLRAAETHIARKRGHSSSSSAAEFAKEIGAKRLILNHTSVGYDSFQVRALEEEARRAFGSDDAYVAHEMSVFSVPTERQDCPEWAFRIFLGHPRFGNYTLLRNAAALYNKSNELPDASASTEGLDLAMADESEIDIERDLQKGKECSRTPANVSEGPAETPDSRTATFPPCAHPERSVRPSKRITLDESDLAAPLREYDFSVSENG